MKDRQQRRDLIFIMKEYAFMSIVFEQASSADIDELIRMRIAYMADDRGTVSDSEREAMKRQLPDYFARKLGTELIAFAAKDQSRIVSTAFLHIIEMPANSVLPNGLYGVVLNVYTEPDYRGRGLCTGLLKELIAYGKERGLGRIDLQATPEGAPIYRKAGFIEKDKQYTDMRYTFKA